MVIRRALIKVGTPLPNDKNFKFLGAERTKKLAEKNADERQAKDHDLGIIIIPIPNRYALYGRKSHRITPKTPRLK